MAKDGETNKSLDPQVATGVTRVSDAMTKLAVTLSNETNSGQRKAAMAEAFAAFVRSVDLIDRATTTGGKGTESVPSLLAQVRQDVRIWSNREIPQTTQTKR